MEIGMQELAQMYTKHHNSSWYHDKGQNSYALPRTLLKEDYVGPFQESNMENRSIEIKYSNEKGYKFDKAKRCEDKSKEKPTPGPTSYFLKSKNSIKQQLKINASPAFKKYSRFDEPKSSQIGVGVYNVNSNSIQKESKKSTKGSLSKAITVSYFEQTMLLGTLVPGPGQYNLRDKNRCKSQHIQNILKKHGSLDLIKKKIAQKHSIGPMSYMIPRSTSQTCTVKMMANYKQIDPRLKLSLQKMKKQNKQAIKTGPGKYLRIDEWCKYQKDKKLPTGLTLLAKPNPASIYN